jgi:hypothetical protein
MTETAVRQAARRRSVVTRPLAENALHTVGSSPASFSTNGPIARKRIDAATRQTKLFAPNLPSSGKESNLI